MGRKSVIRSLFSRKLERSGSIEGEDNKSASSATTLAKTTAANLLLQGSDSAIDTSNDIFQSSGKSNLPSPLADKQNVTGAQPLSTIGDIRAHLWARAFKLFCGRDHDDAMKEYIRRLSILQDDGTPDVDLSNRQSVETIVNKLQADREQGQWKLTIYDHDVKIRSQVEKLLKLLAWSDPIVKSAISTQPYAALAWSGVSLIIPVSPYFPIIEHLLTAVAHSKWLQAKCGNDGGIQRYWRAPNVLEAVRRYLS